MQLCVKERGLIKKDAWVNLIPKMWKFRNKLRLKHQNMA